MPASNPVSNRRIEEASLNAWPAVRQMLLDGWLLRFSHGFTKRANSIVPLYPVLQPMEDKVRHCENLYARERLQAIFRLTSVTDCAPLDGYLAERGYTRVDPTHVLTTNLNHLALPRGGNVRWSDREAWLQTYARLTSMPEEARALHGAIIKGIQGECAYAVTGGHDQPEACGLGVLEQDLVGLFDIYTAPSSRGRGHAQALVAGLLGWARERGARVAYLQMVAGNEPARALYGKYGFSKAYEYWYRVSP